MPIISKVQKGDIRIKVKQYSGRPSFVINNNTSPPVANTKLLTEANAELLTENDLFLEVENA